MSSIYIPIHSFSDLITNSSSETYVCATDSTEKCVKDIINSLLKFAGSTQTADDLFEFDFAYTIDVGRDFAEKAKSVGIDGGSHWYGIPATKSQIVAFAALLTEDELEDFTFPWDKEGYNINLKVIPKDKTNKDTQMIARLLEHMQETYNCSSEYNG